ncbi:glycosyltransferase family 4 protein [Halioglobus sp.]|nr:glycosyltransferase family 4 protein [Halioglobus sp.]
MNLILNAEALRPPITGVGNYSFYLLEQYLKRDYFDEIECFTGTHWQSGQEQLGATTALKSRGAQDDYRAWEKLASDIRMAIGHIPGTKALYDSIMDRRFERYANAVPDAVYHETNYILKPYAGPCVTTVHDLSHIRYPDCHPPNVIDWLGSNLAATLDRADCIITVSNIIREELLEHYRLSEDKVVTIYEGVDERYKIRSGHELQSALAPLGLEEKQYVLLTATLEPRKGIDVLLDAWSLLPLSLRQTFPLVITGSSGWRNSGLVDRIEAFIEEGTVHHLGYVQADLLPYLFSGASVFSYPSVYEGFGLPVLDAMRSGVPVICRAGTSMAEFAEGACVLCDTGEAEELASYLKQLLENPEERAVWAERGCTQAKNFSWKRCADETLAVYRAIT